MQPSSQVVHQAASTVRVTNAKSNIVSKKPSNVAPANKVAKAASLAVVAASQDTKQQEKKVVVDYNSLLSEWSWE